MDFIIPSIINTAAPADTGRQLLSRHPLLDTNMNSGVRFLGTVFFSQSYPGGGTPGTGGTRPAAANPTDGQTIHNVAATDIFGNAISGLVDGSISVTTSIGGVVTLAGGGLDFTSAERNNSGAGQGCGILADATVSADIKTAYSGNNQLFLMCGLFKLPPENDSAWSGKGSQETILGTQGGSAGGIGNVNIKGPGTALSFLRQVALSTNDTELDIPVITPGGLCLIGAYRELVGSTYYSGLYYQSATERHNVTQASPTANTADFSAAKIGAGYPQGYTNYNNAVNPLRSGLRNYEMMVENLARSGRDPVATMDAYWSWIQNTLIPWDIARHGSQTILV